MQQQTVGNNGFPTVWNPKPRPRPCQGNAGYNPEDLNSGPLSCRFRSLRHGNKDHINTVMLKTKSYLYNIKLFKHTKVKAVVCCFSDPSSTKTPKVMTTTIIR